MGISSVSCITVGTNCTEYTSDGEEFISDVEFKRNYN